jgi:hypothetical protein
MQLNRLWLCFVELVDQSTMIRAEIQPYISAECAGSLRFRDCRQCRKTPVTKRLLSVLLEPLSAALPLAAHSGPLSVVSSDYLSAESQGQGRNDEPNLVLHGLDEASSGYRYSGGRSRDRSPVLCASY